MRVWLCVALAGCTGKSPAPPIAAKPIPPAPARGTLIVAVDGVEITGAPLRRASALDSVITGMQGVPMFETSFDCGLKYGPSLAESWTWSEDERLLTVSLRDDMRWEDGVPVTAHDVVFTYSLSRHPRSSHGHLTEYMAPDSPVAVDDHTLIFEFSKAYDRATQLAHASLDPVPKHIFAATDPNELLGPGLVVGPHSFGPFIVGRNAPGEQIVLEVNGGFRGSPQERAKLDRVVFRDVNSYEARIALLEAGDVDLVAGVRPEDVRRLAETHPEIRSLRRGPRAMDYVGWNPTNFGPFAEPEVRHALALGVDVQRMMETLLGSPVGEGYGARAVGTFTPALCDLAPEIEPIPYSPEDAKDALARAGWADSDGDGILEREGVPFAFTLTTNDGYDRRARAAHQIKEDLAHIGISVTVAVVPTSLFFRSVSKGDYEAFLSGWSASLFLDPSSIWGSAGPNNFVHYRDAEVDALITQGLAERDPAVAASIWKELQRRIHADQPYLFLWWTDEVVAVHERFEGVEVDLISPYSHLERWSVPPSQVKPR